MAHSHDLRNAEGELLLTRAKTKRREYHIRLLLHEHLVIVFNGPPKTGAFEVVEARNYAKSRFL